jgi:hypothetical protein
MSLLKVRYLMGRGLSLTQSVDRTIVRDEGIPTKDWAEIRGVSERAVLKNIEDADAILQETLK